MRETERGRRGGGEQLDEGEKTKQRRQKKKKIQSLWAQTQGYLHSSHIKNR